MAASALAVVPAAYALAVLRPPVLGLLAVFGSAAAVVLSVPLAAVALWLRPGVPARRTLLAVGAGLATHAFLGAAVLVVLGEPALLVLPAAVLGLVGMGLPLSVGALVARRL